MCLRSKKPLASLESLCFNSTVYEFVDLDVSLLRFRVHVMIQVWVVLWIEIREFEIQEGGQVFAAEDGDRPRHSFAPRRPVRVAEQDLADSVAVQVRGQGGVFGEVAPGPRQRAGKVDLDARHRAA